MVARRPLDGHGEFRTEAARPAGGEPVLSPPAPESYAQAEQIQAPGDRSPQLSSQRPEQEGGGLVDRVKDTMR